MEKRDLIFGQFLYSRTLRFSEIERSSGLRSNELAYYLKQMQEEGIIEKQGELYALSGDAEKEIPFFSEDGARAPLPVVLVEVLHEGKTLFIKRAKRPYQGKWSLPGGRIRMGETVEEAARRIVREKAFLDADILGLCAVGNERVFEGEKPKHGFVLLCVQAMPAGPLRESSDAQWFSCDDIRHVDAIESDCRLAFKKTNIRLEEFMVQKEHP